MSHDDILDAIDDVLADWRGGPDAMVWSAESPDREVAGALRGERDVAYEARHGAAGMSGERARTAARSLMRGVAEWARSDDVRRMVALVREVEGRVREEGGPCHCPCGVRHSGGICTGTAAGTRLYASLGDGLADVPMCGPCLASG